MTQGVGLSIGATNVAAVVGGAAATRRSVLTLYRSRSPEVGVPSENPSLSERGLVVTGFVDRAGDPVDVMAADGSFHRGEVLIADALCAMAHTVTGRMPPSPPGVSFPAHWPAAAVDALRRELAKRPEWAGGAKAPTLVSDAAAALTALHAEPGLPTRGVVALCDFGGTGTSITLADAANGYRPIGATMRHADFSGELVDRALLAHVIADLSIAGTGDVAGTAAFASLHRLRAECRGAKERLSRSTATTLFADVPGFRGDVRLTRSELDDEIRQPLASLIEVLRELLFRNRIHPSELAAVATVGGGAQIPAVTTALSEGLRVPVIIGSYPELTAARGAAIRAVRLPEDDSLTVAAAAMQSGTLRALAWSEVDDVADIAPMAVRCDGPRPVSTGRPPGRFASEQPARDAAPEQPWYRPLLVTAVIFAAMLFVGTGAVLALRNDASAMTGTITTTTTVAPDPNTPAAAAPAEQPQAEVPSAPSFLQAPAPVTRVIVTTPPPVIAMAAPAPAAIAPQAAPPPPQEIPLPAPPIDPTPTTPTTTSPPSSPPPSSQPPSSVPSSPPSSSPPSSSAPSSPPSNEEPPPSKETPSPAGNDTPAPEPPPAKPSDQPK